MNGRWVKSNKVVNFPMTNFDPSEFVVKRPMSDDYDATEEASGVRTLNVRTVANDATEKECSADVHVASAKVSVVRISICDVILI